MTARPRRYTLDELAEAGATLRRVVAAVAAGELTAPATLVARLEGAALVFEVLATGRVPDAADLLGDSHLHDTDV